MKFLMEMRVRKRLNTTFAFILGTGLLAVLTAVICMMVMTGRYDHTLENYAFPQGDIGRVMNAFAEVRSDTRAVIGYEEADAIAQAMTSHEDHVKELYMWMDEVEKTMVTKDGKEAFAAIETALDAYFVMEAKVLEIGNTTDQALCDQAQEMAINELRPLYDVADAAIVHLMDVNVEKGDNTQSLLHIVEYIIIAGIVVLFIVTLIVVQKMAKIVSDSVERPLKMLGDRLETFAEGDLDSPFPKMKYHDEVTDLVQTTSNTAEKLKKIFQDTGDMMNEMASGNFRVESSIPQEYTGDFSSLLESMKQMNEQIRYMLKEVDDAAKQVSAGSTNMAEAAQALAEGATDQAASVQELHATITDITEAVHITAAQMEENYNQAHRYAEEAEKSRMQMAAMMAAMDRMNETSQKIGNIISEIEDIASQTNLLSLNASIEAARAGDAGRGFAVVADQIGKLAEQSAQSAVDTRQLIEGSIREVEDGNKAAQAASESLATVVGGMKEIAESSKRMSDASRDQAKSMEQAELGVNRISEVVESNSAAAEESSATSEELSAQAISMSEMVSVFKV